MQLTALALLLAVGAPKAAVAPLRGKGGDVCASKLGEVFKEHADIVPLDAGVEGIVSWKDLQRWMDRHGRETAEIVVVGSLGNKSIVLEAYAVKQRKLIGLKSLRTLSRCRLSPRGKRVLSVWFTKVLGNFDPNAPPAAGPPPEPPPPATEPAPPPATPATKKEPASSEAPAGAVEREADPDGDGQGYAPYSIAIGVSLALTRRGLRFVGPQTSNLRGYDIDLMPVPELSMRAFVLPRSLGFISALGVSASLARTIGLASERIEGGPRLDSVFTEASAGLLYRWLVPVDWFKAYLVPEVGYHHLSFAVKPTGGALESDLPDVGYSSASFGMGIEAMVLAQVDITLSGRFLLVLDGGEVFGPAFFERGSARGYRIDLSMRYRFPLGLALELHGHHMAYSLSLDAEPTDRRIARSASDTLSGIGLGLRWSL